MKADHDEAACHEAGKSHPVACIVCGELFRDGDMIATDKGLVCENCYRP